MNQSERKKTSIVTVRHKCGHVVGHSFTEARLKAGEKRRLELTVCSACAFKYSKKETK